jgi:hypothetical protein
MLKFSIYLYILLAMCRAGGFLKGQSFHHSIYIQIFHHINTPPRIPTLPGTAVVLCFLCTVIDATSPLQERFPNLYIAHARENARICNRLHDEIDFRLQSWGLHNPLLELVQEAPDQSAHTDDQYGDLVKAHRVPRQLLLHAEQFRGCRRV